MAIIWEELKSERARPGFLAVQFTVYRSKVPGGWLVYTQSTFGEGASGMAFVPDPNHEWDGNSTGSEPFAKPVGRL
jgi:hypothetical protein